MATPTANAGSTSTADSAGLAAALLRGEAAAVGGWDLVLAGSTSAAQLQSPAWIVGGLDELAAKAGALPWAVRRLMRRLTPGPLVVRFAPADRSSAPAGAIGPDGLLAVASPEGPAITQTLDALRARAASAAVLGVERTGAGTPATVVSLAKTPMGMSVRIDRPGTYEERFIRRQLERTVLFVCTGNTCRSPMAEAIANSLIDERGESGTLHAASAGISATSGEPPSREVAGALASVGVPVPSGRGGSRGLTARMIEDADVVYTMTKSHRQAVAAMSPRSTAKVQLLDPQGGDVADPIGQGPEVYAATAQRLKELIAARLEELDS